MSFWMWTICNLISIACGTYNVRKFWTRRTSGSVRWWTIACKYAYKNLMLQSRSPTHSVVMNARSSARDRSSRIDYWTLNSRNVNSMFAASGWFMRRRSQLCVFTTMYHSSLSAFMTNNTSSHTKKIAKTNCHANNQNQFFSLLSSDELPQNWINLSWQFSHKTTGIMLSSARPHCFFHNLEVLQGGCKPPTQKLWLQLDYYFLHIYVCKPNDHLATKHNRIYQGVSWFSHLLRFVIGN